MLGDRPPESVRDRLLILRASNQMSGLDGDARMRLAEQTRYRRFARGETIYRYGEAIDTVFMVYDGVAEVSRPGREPFEVAAPGGLGFPSVVAADPRGIDCVARTELRALALAADVIYDLYESNFAFLRSTLRITAQTLKDKRGGLPAAVGSVHDAPLGDMPEAPESFVERLIAYSRVPLLADANIDGFTGLARGERELRYAAGDVLWRIGDASESGLRLRYGRVRCTNAQGETCVVGAPYIMGQIDGLAGGPRTYTAVCETPVVALEIAFEPYLRVLEDHVDVATALMRGLSRGAWDIDV